MVSTNEAWSCHAWLLGVQRARDRTHLLQLHHAAAAHGMRPASHMVQTCCCNLQRMRMTACSSTGGTTPPTPTCGTSTRRVLSSCTSSGLVGWVLLQENVAANLPHAWSSSGALCMQYVLGALQHIHASNQPISRSASKQWRLTWCLLRHLVVARHSWPGGASPSGVPSSTPPSVARRRRKFPLLRRLPRPEE